MNFSEILKTEIAPWNMLRHPFYQSWFKGELSKETLRNYSIQYVPFVDSFPRFVSRIHSQCPDPSARKFLLANLIEEEGYPTTTDHPTLWRQFAQGLGVEKEALEMGPYTSDSQALAKTFWNLCNSSYGEGLSALFSYEHQIPEVAKAKIEGLAQFYGINSKGTLEFFSVHQVADEHHSKTCEVLLNSLKEEEKEPALAAAKKATQSLWDFLSSCENSCRSQPN